MVHGNDAQPASISNSQIARQFAIVVHIDIVTRQIVIQTSGHIT